MADELMRDLPDDLPTFLTRFGTDAQCRAYLARGRWPEGFRCAGCGHARAYSHHVRLIEECAACGKQHSLLAGTIFEQTKTGLARWFLGMQLPQLRSLALTSSPRRSGRLTGSVAPVE